MHLSFSTGTPKEPFPQYALAQESIKRSKQNKNEPMMCQPNDKDVTFWQVGTLNPKSLLWFYMVQKPYCQLLSRPYFTVFNCFQWHQWYTGKNKNSLVIIFHHWRQGFHILPGKHYIIYLFSVVVWKVPRNSCLRP